MLPDPPVNMQTFPVGARMRYPSGWRTAMERIRMRLFAWLSGMLFGAGSNPLENFGVQEITTTSELDAALANSDSRGVFLFKHSTTCPISSSAYRRVAEYLEGQGPQAVPLYLVKVIESRPVSNEIAARFSVRHESPQALLVREGRCVWNASHGSITAPAMARAGSSS